MSPTEIFGLFLLKLEKDHGTPFVVGPPSPPLTYTYTITIIIIIMTKRMSSGRLSRATHGNRRWMSGAVKKKNRGKFTAYCKRKGHKGVTDGCINEALRSGNKTTMARAKFAKSARSIAAKKKSK